MFNQNTFYKSPLALAILMLVSTTSCDFVFKPNNKTTMIKRSNKIKTYKQEAKLLVNASELNLRIVNICKLNAEINEDSSVSKITNRLKSTQLLISKRLSRIAKDKLISIPDTIYNVKYKEFYSDKFLKSDRYLSKVSSLLTEQLVSLKQLTIHSQDKDLRSLSLDLRMQLNNQKDRINQLVESGTNTVSIAQ